MIYRVWATTVGELVEFLEKEIAAGRNPKTQEEWDAAMQRMNEEGRNKKTLNFGGN